MRQLIFTVIFLALSLTAARAANLPVIAPPFGFQLLDPGEMKRPGGPAAYANTGGTPNWSIASWGIAGGKLPPFTETRHGANRVLTSQAAESGVVVTQAPNGSTSYVLSQNGAALPCGTARESDLFAAPNGRNPTPPAITGLLIPAGKPLTLSSLAELIATTTVTANYGNATPVLGCRVSQGSPLISVILNNPTAKQTFFYQLELSHFCGPQLASRMAYCQAQSVNPGPSYYFLKNPFGADDPLSNFGQPWLANHETRTISVDLLPHLKYLLANGPAALDHDPAHWIIGTYYNGQHIWGDVTLTTDWQNISLLAITP